MLSAMAGRNQVEAGIGSRAARAMAIVTKSNVGPYLSTPSRYEGSTSQQKLIGRSGPIKNPIATTST